MRYIQSPDELTNVAIGEVVVFMAGGITGAEDWQAEVAKKVKYGTIVNPRREEFDMSQWKSISAEQIAWEHRHIKMANWIYFWFPKEAQCTITLFELGCALGEKQNIRIGVEPGYYRELDIREQVKHRRSELKIYETLDELYEPLYNYD